MIVRCLKLYAPVFVVLIGAFIEGVIDRGVGLTVVLLVVLAWAITVHTHAVSDKIRHDRDRRQH